MEYDERIPTEAKRPSGRHHPVRAVPGVLVGGRGAMPMLPSTTRSKTSWPRSSASRVAEPTSPTEALGTQGTFENSLRTVRPGGTVSSLGVYSGHLTMPHDAIVGGLGDHTVVTTICPGGKERMRRLMSGIRSKRFPFRELITHSFGLAEIEVGYDLFASQRDGVLKVAIRP
jgi:hypothetical protein